MMNKYENQVFVFGHKNPDTDSVCSAVAYANLKNSMQKDKVYVPARIGNVTPQTQFIFDYSNIELPHSMTDIHTRVEDIMTPLEEIVYILDTDPVLRLFQYASKYSYRTYPVVGNDGAYKYTLSFNELMNSSNFLTSTGVGNTAILSDFTAENIEATLGVAPIVRNEHKDKFHGRIVVGISEAETMRKYIESMPGVDIICIAGNRLEIIKMCLELQIAIIIVNRISEEEIRASVDLSKYKNSWIFISNYHSDETIMRVSYSSPVASILPEIMDRELIMKTETVRLEDNIHVVKSKLNNRAVPVLSVVDEDERLLGVVSLADLVRDLVKEVALVDHNEISQAVDGIESAEIVAIIDHHKLGTITTNNPIEFYAKPLGSTCSLVYELYKINKVELPVDIAKLLLSGILTDTVILRSPTTTDYDIQYVDELSKLTGIVDFRSYGRLIFDNSGGGLLDQTIDNIVGKDLKEFKEGKYTISVSQCEVTSFNGFDTIKANLFDKINSIKEHKHLDWVLLLVTNITSEESYLLCTEYKNAENALPYSKVEEHLYFCPGVLSRKKQLMPVLLPILK